MMTKSELYDYINVMLDAGKTRQQVADLLHCDIKVVRRAAESRKYDHMLTLVMIDWEATCNPIRKYLKKAAAQDESGVKGGRQERCCLY